VAFIVIFTKKTSGIYSSAKNLSTDRFILFQGEKDERPNGLLTGLNKMALLQPAWRRDSPENKKFCVHARAHQEQQPTSRLCRSGPFLTLAV